MPSPALNRELIIWGRTALKPDLFEFRADRGVFEDAGTDPAEDTDPVYQWSDQGPASRFATQATLASRPTLSSAAVPNYLSLATDDFMTFGGSTVFANSTAAWTLEAWLNLTAFPATPSFPGVFGLKSNTTNLFQVGISNDANYLGLHFGSATTWPTLKTSTAGATWLGVNRHIIITYNGAGATVAANFAAYIDGVRQTLTAASAFSSATNTGSVIGASDLTAAQPWNGRAYKYAGFSSALNQTQVSARFALGVAG
jgi:hypothetical protein